MLTKKELRTIISTKKREYTIEDRKNKSKAILEDLKATEEFRSAKSVLCYWSMSDEVYTHQFVQDIAHDKTVYLPVVSGDTLLIRQFNGVSNLIDGEAFAIPEPDTNATEVDINEIDLVIVPGVAFDLEGGRLGRGKGFYDRLLANASSDIVKIGVCFDFQVVDCVPRDDFDILMNKIILD